MVPPAGLVIGFGADGVLHQPELGVESRFHRVHEIGTALHHPTVGIGIGIVIVVVVVAQIQELAPVVKGGKVGEILCDFGGGEFEFGGNQVCRDATRGLSGGFCFCCWCWCWCGFDIGCRIYNLLSHERRHWWCSCFRRCGCCPPCAVPGSTETGDDEPPVVPAMKIAFVGQQQERRQSNLLLQDWKGDLECLQNPLAVEPGPVGLGIALEGRCGQGTFPLDNGG